jgi:hypothetical protein
MMGFRHPHTSFFVIKTVTRRSFASFGTVVAIGGEAYIFR